MKQTIRKTPEEAITIGTNGSQSSVIVATRHHDITQSTMKNMGGLGTRLLHNIIVVHPETEHLFVNGIMRSGKQEEHLSEPYTTMRTNASIQNSGPKLGSHIAPLPTEKKAWHTSISISVLYYVTAASCSALLSGCTLGFPSGAVLDLTDSEPRKEYKFDGQLSDIFGVR